MYAFRLTRIIQTVFMEVLCKPILIVLLQLIHNVHTQRLIFKLTKVVDQKGKQEFFKPVVFNLLKNGALNWIYFFCTLDFKEYKLLLETIVFFYLLNVIV